VAPSDLFPSDDEIEKLLKQTTFAPQVSDTVPDPLESPPPSPIRDYMIFKATQNVIYEEIYSPFNDDLGDYFDMLYISSNPNPQ